MLPSSGTLPVHVYVVLALPARVPIVLLQPGEEGSLAVTLLIAEGVGLVTVMVNWAVPPWSATVVEVVFVTTMSGMAAENASSCAM